MRKTAGGAGRAVTTRKLHPGWYRPACAAVAVLSMWALFMPVRAEPMDMPGGLDVQFCWGLAFTRALGPDMASYSYGFRAADFFLVLPGGLALLATWGRYLRHAVSPPAHPSIGWTWACLVALIALRALLDLANVVEGGPLSYGSPWTALAFSGSASVLASLAVQGAILVGLYRARRSARPPDRAVASEVTEGQG